MFCGVKFASFQYWHHRIIAIKYYALETDQNFVVEMYFLFYAFYRENFYYIWMLIQITISCLKCTLW